MSFPGVEIRTGDSQLFYSQLPLERLVNFFQLFFLKSFSAELFYQQLFVPAGGFPQPVHPAALDMWL